MIQRFTQDGPRKRQRRKAEKDIVSIARKEAQELTRRIEEHIEDRKHLLKNYYVLANEYDVELLHYNELSDDEKMVFPPNVEAYVMERLIEDLRGDDFDDKFEDCTIVEAVVRAIEIIAEDAEEEELFYKAWNNKTYEKWKYPYNTKKSLPALKAGDKAYIIKRDLRSIRYMEVTVTDPTYPICTIVLPGDAETTKHGRRGLFSTLDEAKEVLLAQAKRRATTELKKLKEKELELTTFEINPCFNADIVFRKSTNAYKDGFYDVYLYHKGMPKVLISGFPKIDLETGDVIKSAEEVFELYMEESANDDIEEYCQEYMQ